MKRSQEVINPRLSSATWREVEAYLKTNNAILIPTGSVEQHGPSGLMGTDHLTATAVAEEVGKKLGIYVAAPLCYGMASHHMAFAGSVTLRPSVYQAVLCEILRSFYRHGFRRFYVVNGHGGNTFSIQAAFQEMKHEGASEASFYLYNWWLLPEVVKLAQELYGDREGRHGTPSEVSMTFYLENIEKRVLPEEFDVTPLKAPWPVSGEELRKLSPTGLMMSDPNLARREHGAKFLEVAAQSVIDSVGKAPVFV